jgi:hypothetical protein
MNTNSLIHNELSENILPEGCIPQWRINIEFWTVNVVDERLRTVRILIEYISSQEMDAQGPL